MIKIINNLICKKQQEDLNKIVNSNHFPWYFLANVLQGRDKNFKQFNNITETYALVHTLFALPEGVNSDFFKYFKVVTDSFEKKENIKIKDLLRIRIRRTFFIKGHNNSKYNYPHIDLPEVQNYKSLVYYFENSDGDTIFFKEKATDNVFDLNNLSVELRNKPKQGSAVYFDGDIYHSGNSPVDSVYRTVLNFDFTIHENNR